MESILWLIVMGGLFYVMMKHGCGVHMRGYGAHGEGHASHGGCYSGHGERRLRALSQNVTDPVCGMDIDRDQAYGMIRKYGRKIFFCSETCYERFRTAPNPERYLYLRPNPPYDIEAVGVPQNS